LKLHNFRNYEKLEIDFSRDFNILYGENAQGKTNIIEAIFLCASGRSHRTSKDAELVRLDSDGYYVKLDIEKNASDTEVEIAYKKDDKRRIRINDIPVGRIGELVGQLNVVIFSPEDLLVIKEGPAERRRFLDITLSQLRPSYFYDLQQYSKILSQRNSLLKEIQFNNKLMDTLEIWNSNLVKTGSRIIKARRAFIEKLNIVAENMHYKLTDGKEKLETKYAPSVSKESVHL
jgi:DNA replication and repair protein RecF